MNNVRFRLIGINQDNRSDGTGKAGLTFQAVGYYSISSKMNTVDTNAGGWRDSMLRKNLNDESTGTIWNVIQSTDFKNNITPVLKITNNNANNSYNSYTLGNSNDTSNASSITADKLWILSPSEMGIPIIMNYKDIYGWGLNQSDANVHYYDSDSYKNTIKASSHNCYSICYWYAAFNNIYDGDAYQWWMLPSVSRKMSNNNQAYHNTDSYSYCTLDSSNPSTNKECESSYFHYMLRSPINYFFSAYESNPQHWYLIETVASYNYSVVVSFSL